MNFIQINKSLTKGFLKAAWIYYIGFFKAYKFKLLTTVVGAVLLSLLIIPILLLIKYIFDVIIPEKEIDMLLVVGLAIILIRFVESGFTMILRRINIKVVASVILSIRDEIIKKVIHLPKSYYTNEDKSVLHTRIIQDTERILDMSNAITSGFIPSLFIAFGLCIILAFFNWYLFVIIVIFFPVIFFTAKYTSKKLKQKVFTYHREYEKFSKGVMFILNSLDLINIHSTTSSERKKQKLIHKNLSISTIDRYYFHWLSNQTQSYLAGIISVMIIIIGGGSVIYDLMSLGAFFAFYFAANRLQIAINSISDSFSAIVIGNESLLSIHEIYSIDKVDPYLGDKKIEFSGDITLENVTFGYSKKVILNNLSFSIQKGSKIAIIGSNGVGKSTLVNLILGFYAPQIGCLYADDVSYFDLDIQFLRKSVGVVTQQQMLVPGSVKENIKYGCSDVDDEDIIRVSKLVLAHDFIKNLPEGYDTKIEDDGAILSGGEIQKIIIARTIIRKPQIIILDEPTNHLDNVAIKKIMSGIWDLENNPTVIIISHDMDVANYAEKIYLLKDGQLE